MGREDGSSPQRVVLLGAAGVTGRSALTALRAAGCEVLAHSRRVGTGADLPMPDDDAVRWVGGDIIDDGAHLRRVLDGADAVIDLRVALPTSLKTVGAMRHYSSVRDKALGAVVDACMHLQVPRVVHDTVTMVYRDGGAQWLDESSPVSAPGPMRANLTGEEHLRRFTEGGGTGVDLRLGMVHGGPDDPITAMLESAARRGWFGLPGRADGYLATIAVVDVGRAVVAALGAPAGIYNVAEEPQTRAAWRAEYARRAGRRDLRSLPGLLGGPMGRSQRVSSALFAETTGWSPAAEPFSR